LDIFVIFHVLNFVIPLVTKFVALERFVRILM